MSFVSSKILAGVGLLTAILAVGWWGYACQRQRSQTVLDELTQKVRWEGPWYYRVAKQTHTVQFLHRRVLKGSWLLHQISLTRLEAVQALSRMGTNAWPAVPALVTTTMHKDLSIGVPAAEALVGIKAEECPEWVRLRKGLAGQTMAAMTFRYLVVGNNITGISYDLAHRRFGLLGLAATGPAAAVAYGDIVEILRFSNESELRFWAVVALGGMGAEKRETLPVLKKVLQDPEEWPNVRAAAAQALVNVAPKDEETRVLLQQMLQDPRAAVRLGAARALWKANGTAEQILAVLTPLLGHRLATIRAGALEGVSEMGKAALGSKPEVERLLSDENETVRRAATAVLKSLAGQ
jgi:HEAT repeat protein